MPGPALVLANAHGFSEVLRAFAALLWPIVVFVALYLFRTEIANLIRRIRKGKAGPVEFELAEELEQLGKRADEAERAVPPRAADNEGESEQTRVAEDVLTEARSDPRLALMTLS